MTKIVASTDQVFEHLADMPIACSAVVCVLEGREGMNLLQMLSGILLLVYSCYCWCCANIYSTTAGLRQTTLALFQRRCCHPNENDPFMHKSWQGTDAITDKDVGVAATATATATAPPSLEKTHRRADRQTNHAMTTKLSPQNPYRLLNSQTKNPALSVLRPS